MGHKEDLKKQNTDAEMIFKQITNGNFDDFDMAQQAVVTLYVPDMSISRAGISLALKRLEQHYKEGLKG